MVGSGGAKEIRKWLLNLSAYSNTSLEYWEKQSLISLNAWTEALSAEDENDVKNT